MELHHYARFPSCPSRRASGLRDTRCIDRQHDAVNAHRWLDDVRNVSPLRCVVKIDKWCTAGFGVLREVEIAARGYAP
jgi:hypothetical protein